MHALGLEYSYEQRDPTRRYKGVAVVVAVHLLIGWALVSGTVHNAVKIVQTKVQVTMVEAEIPPPPKPPIKPPEVQQQPQLQQTYMPTPELAQPTSESTLAVPSEAQPPQTQVAIAPPAQPPTRPVATRTDIAVACPTQVAPEMPRKAMQDGTSGVVKAQALISGGVVKDVQILSGPRVFHAPVRQAMLQYRCNNDGQGDVTAVQEFNFRLE